MEVSYCLPICSDPLVPLVYIYGKVRTNRNQTKHLPTQ